MAEDIVRIISKPGIKRDGTRLEGDNYVDGQWVRFQRGLPRKIGGYRSISKYLRGLARSLFEYTQDNLTYVHAGAADRLESFYIDGTYNTSTVADRTPAALVANANNMWQFDVETTAAASGLQIVAHVAPNLTDICSSVNGQLFYGSLFGTGPLTQVTALPAGASLSGGVVSLHPYTVIFGADGYVAWSPDCADFTVVGAGNAYVTGQKIIRGLPMRGGPGSSPSGLLWSADSVIRMTYTGNATNAFSFDTISAQSSIMSAASVIEYDGIFYWIGVDRFLQFNGVVREVENSLNSNFFFDNLNFAQRQKVFAMKVPRFGEIWWCFPLGDSLEPNHAIIYNVRENTWYDTALPNGGRGAGLFPAVFAKPLMSGVEPHYSLLYGAAIAAAGTGYVVGDTLAVVGGIYQIAAEITVGAVNGTGGITAVSISNAGEYSTVPTSPLSVTGGHGTGAKFTGTFNAPYKFWVHEVGVNEVDELSVNPIQSYFETADISMPVQAQVNKAIHVALMEPDFVQSGPMTVEVHGRANARAPEVNGEPMTIPENASVPTEQVVFFKTQRRELRFRFESNCVNGDYQMGLILAHISPSDGTVLG